MSKWQHLVVLFLVLVSAFTLPLMPNWQSVSGYFIDLQSTLFAANRQPAQSSSLLIINIDEASLQYFDDGWPWPRARHAKLIERLHQAGANAIVFDVLFDVPSAFGQADDAALSDAITRTQKVYLAEYEFHQMLAEGYQIITVGPHNLFIDSGATTVNVGIQFDGDGIVRRAPKFNNTLWQRLSNHTQQTNQPLYIDYVGPANTLPQLSYYRALDPTLTPAHFFKNKTILIGLNLLATNQFGLQQDDRYLTPYSHLTGHSMAGVEIHANLLLNAQHNRFISPLNPTKNTLTVIVSALLSMLLFYKYHPARSALFCLAAIAAILAIGVAAIQFKTSLPTEQLVLCLLISYLSYALIAHAKERKHRRFITKAFSHYVSSKVLHQLMDSPSKLTLGGESKNVTIMFTDLANFTRISETMSPHKVSELLQQHLSIMSQIIVDHGGTLDKYIGDAIMAFWGAPLADPNQCSNALSAAIKMQKAQQQLNQTLIEQGFPELTVRIGIHYGEAVVGNMGSTNLFDYTCIGDSVNLASRLEGLNKQYNSTIICSEQLVKQIDIPDQFKLLDEVAVKGRNQHVKIYTPTDTMRCQLVP